MAPKPSIAEEFGTTLDAFMEMFNRLSARNDANVLEGIAEARRINNTPISPSEGHNSSNDGSQSPPEAGQDVRDTGTPDPPDTVASSAANTSTPNPPETVVSPAANTSTALTDPDTQDLTTIRATSPTTSIAESDASTVIVTSPRRNGGDVSLSISPAHARHRSGTSTPNVAPRSPSEPVTRATASPASPANPANPASPASPAAVNPAGPVSPANTRDHPQASTIRASSSFNTPDVAHSANPSLTNELEADPSTFSTMRQPNSLESTADPESTDAIAASGANTATFPSLADAQGYSDSATAGPSAPMDVAAASQTLGVPIKAQGDLVASQQASSRDHEIETVRDAAKFLHLYWHCFDSEYRPSSRKMAQMTRIMGHVLGMKWEEGRDTEALLQKIVAEDDKVVDPSSTVDVDEYLQLLATQIGDMWDSTSSERTQRILHTSASMMQSAVKHFQLSWNEAETTRLLTKIVAWKTPWEVEEERSKAEERKAAEEKIKATEEKTKAAEEKSKAAEEHSKAAEEKTRKIAAEMVEANEEAERSAAAEKKDAETRAAEVKKEEELEAAAKKEKNRKDKKRDKRERYDRNVNNRV